MAVEDQAKKPDLKLVPEEELDECRPSALVGQNELIA